MCLNTKDFQVVCNVLEYLMGVFYSYWQICFDVTVNHLCEIFFKILILRVAFLINGLQNVNDHFLFQI